MLSLSETFFTAINNKFQPQITIKNGIGKKNGLSYGIMIDVCFTILNGLFNSKRPGP